MKFLLSLILVACSFIANASPLKAEQYAAAFKNYDACFILYNVTQQKIIAEYNPNNRCQERISPDSTFKIALSLIAFNEKIISPNTLFKWNHKKYEIVEWNQDQTPKTWLKYSVVWVSQKLSPQIGLVRMEDYLDLFHYGNQDFSGDPGQNNGLTHAWLASSLKISALEQLDFLNALLKGKLPLNSQAVANTKENMYLGKLDNGADLYGKTGSGRHGRNERLENPSRLRDGWFVGFIENKNEQYIFVSNLTDKIPVPIDKSNPNAPLNPYGSKLLKPIVLELMNNYFKVS